MNRRYIIIVIIALAILMVAVLRGCQNTPGKVLAPAPSKHSANSTGGIYPKPSKEPITNEELEAVVKEKSIAFSKRNNAPIAFYGRVVDQDGEPLQGVEVDFYVTAIPMVPVLWGPDEKKKGSRITDHNGLFSVEGERGVGFGVTNLRKTGYRKLGYYEQGLVHYEPYSPQRHIPIRDKPLEFMLIRDDLPKAEKMFDQQLRLNWNARVTTIDLGPDVGMLKFNASRTGIDRTNTLKKFEWEVKMSAEGFNLTKLPDENARIAPLEGYGPTARVGFSRNDKIWLLRVSEIYAIRTSSGAYGLMYLRVHGDGGDGGVCGGVTVYLNKGASRNIDHK